jgi:thioesterase domain-containing protein
LDPNGRSYSLDIESASDLGWGKLIGRPIEVIDMDADHVSMIAGDEVIQIARDLRGRISQEHVSNEASDSH